MYIWLREFLWGERAYLTYWYAFLLSFPFSWRKVLIPSVTGGNFNEYLDLSIYIGDILILSSFILIIKHKNIIKSMIRKINMFHVEHITLTLLIAYTLATFLWSDSTALWIDSVWSIIRILLVAGVFTMVLKDSNRIQLCSTWNTLRISVVILSFLVIAQSLIAIGQFSLNQSIGLSIFGESVIAPNIPGVANIETNTGKQVRSYGTFLHPNIFGGFITVSILFIFWYIKRSMFHVEQSKSLFTSKKFHVEQLFLYFSINIALIGLLLTFSKSAIVALILIFLIKLFHVEQNKSLFTSKKFHVEQLYLLVLVCIGLITFFTQGKQIYQSIDERIDVYQNTIDISQNVFFGNGLNQSVLLLSNTDIFDWQLQPIHNIYLLIFFEIGVIGSILLAVVIFRWLYYYVPRGTSGGLYLPLLAIAIIGLFDHYPIDIYVGNVLLGLTIAWFQQDA